MKICILHRYPLNIIEGTNPSFPIFLKKTLALGHEVYLVTFKNQRGSFHNDKLRIKDIGISFNRRNSFDIYIKSLLFIILAPLKVFLLNKKEEFDIIYCDDSFPFYEIMVKLLTDKKVFIRRGDLMCAYILDKFGGLFKFFAALVFAVEHFTWRKVDGISVITERFKQYMLKYGAREDKISVIEDSLDFEKFEFSGSSVDLKTKYGITDEFIVMYHGIMLSIKGLEAFVRAVPLVVEHNKNVKFFMVGAGEELEKIKSLTQELKVDDHIIFTGWVKYDDIQSYINLCDIGIPMRKNTLANNLIVTTALLQYWASSKPVIAPRLEGISQIVEESKNGFLFTPEDPEDLAKKILEAVEKREMLANMGQNGRRFAIERYNSDLIADKMIQFLHLSAKKNK